MSIGEDLAEARRRAGLTVRQVSRQTCIREAVICRIERDDYSACGGDFYARGHIRAIARAVGADPGPLIGEYDAAHPAWPVAAADPLPRTARMPRRRRVSRAAVLRSRAVAAGPAVTGQAGGPARAGRVRRPAVARAGGGWPAARRLPSRLAILVVAGMLVLAGVVVATLAGVGTAVAPGSPGVAWALSPASNTVTVRLTPGAGPSGRRILARSRLAVSEDGNGRLSRQSPDGGTVKVAVLPGRQTRLLVRVVGPRSSSRTLAVTVPPALRVIASRRDRGGLLVQLSGPLRRLPGRPLCGKDAVSFPAPREVAVAKSPDACRTRLTLTGQDGEQAVLLVAVPALPETLVYSFAHSAGRAIYITIDDGWTPSRQVLAIMRRTHLPVTAFLIQQAAQQHLAYWRAFVRAGGTVGDHTVSHPNLTKLTLSQATAQWGQARRTLGRSLGQVPFLGRPPYGAFDRTVVAAAYRAGLTKLVGWSAVADSDGLQTWDGRGLQPGEIVLLHWVPGLGGQLTRLLAVIHARHLVPRPLTAGSFAGITPQRRSLNGD